MENPKDAFYHMGLKMRSHWENLGSLIGTHWENPLNTRPSPLSLHKNPKEKN
jgi:hypothetical protein